MQKRCIKCHVIKPLQDFPKDKRYPDGFTNSCKKCNNKRQLDWTHATGRKKPFKKKGYTILEDGSIQVPLTKGSFAIIDQEDIDLAECNWYVNSCGYAQRVIVQSSSKVIHFMHRIILERKTKRPLGKAELTDHINLNRLDNRRSNLRIATHAQNVNNRPVQSSSKSKYKGIYLIQGRWAARVRHNGKQFFLGLHDTPEQAALAYDKAASEHFGEFAHLNFP